MNTQPSIMCCYGKPTPTPLYRHITPTYPVGHDSNIVFRELPSASSPGPNDVVCARGRQFWNHPGNKHYRDLIGQATKKYSQARNKMEKSLVVLEIIERVHNANGRFIKKESKGGLWIEADDIFAREKCTQSLRDGLSTKYRSATKAKRERRSQHDKQFYGDIDQIVRSNKSVVQQMRSLEQRVKTLNFSRLPVSDDIIMGIFDKANAELLETMKGDSSLHQQFQAAVRSATNESEFDKNVDQIHNVEDDEMSVLDDFKIKGSQYASIHNGNFNMIALY